MNEIEEFIYLLHKHPELIDQLRQIATGQASPPVCVAKKTETNE